MNFELAHAVQNEASKMPPKDEKCEKHMVLSISASTWLKKLTTVAGRRVSRFPCFIGAVGMVFFVLIAIWAQQLFQLGQQCERSDSDKVLIGKPVQKCDVNGKQAQASKLSRSTEL